MPKFIGNNIAAAVEIEPNQVQQRPDRINLTYSQAAMLPASSVMKSLDTSDGGSNGRYAKRWYRWFASADAIMGCASSTASMKRRATPPTVANYTVTRAEQTDQNP